jgi:hypothetical protein
MLAQWQSWLSHSPAIRRPVIKLWRVLLRLQRATLANAVLVLRRDDGSILVLRSPSGSLQLPDMQLEAWIPIPTQVESWLSQILQVDATPSLVAIEGAPGREGVTFLYAATTEPLLAKKAGDELWLDKDVAISSLSATDGRLLRLCINRACQPRGGNLPQ